MFFRSKFMHCMLISALAGFLIGCCPGKSDQDRKAESGASASRMVAASGASLHLDPNYLSGCDLKPGIGQIIEVSWNAAASHISTVKLVVKGPRDSGKVWTSGGAIGKDKTGPWVFPGTMFTLTDGDDRPLAQVTIQSKACTK